MLRLKEASGDASWSLSWTPGLSSSGFSSGVGVGVGCSQSCCGASFPPAAHPPALLCESRLAGTEGRDGILILNSSLRTLRKAGPHDGSQPRGGD